MYVLVKDASISSEEVHVKCSYTKSSMKLSFFVCDVDNRKALVVLIHYV